MKYVLIIFSALIFSCSQKNQKENIDIDKVQKIGGFQYFVKDTISEIVIRHEECTECLDGFRESGKIYISENIMQKIEKVSKEKGLAHIPNGNDLYFIAENKIVEKLFGNTLSPKMGTKYLIKGKVVDFKGYGYIFRIDNYEKVNTESKNKTSR